MLIFPSQFFFSDQLGVLEKKQTQVMANQHIFLNLAFVITLFFDWNSISLVISASREILLAISQWIMFFKSKFTFLFMSFMDLLAYSKLVSSAKWCMSEYFTRLCKSMMYVRKSRGPSTGTLRYTNVYGKGFWYLINCSVLGSFSETCFK